MEDILYIGTDRGVITAHRRDKAAWEVTDRGLRQWEVSELAVSPVAPNRVFAGTRGDGVWVSEDFGKTWTKPSYGRRGPGKVRSITIDPHAPRRIYAGCEPIDIFRSEDEGRNWQRLDSLRELSFIDGLTFPLPTTEPHVRDVEIDPKNPDILYAALQLGFIVKSTDRGQSWTLLDKNIDCDVHVISVDPAAPQRIAVATGGHDSRLGRAPGRAMYFSADGGVSFAPAGMNFHQNYAVPLIRDPHDPRRLYSALANGTAGRWRKRETGAEAVMIRSQDGGENWEAIGRGLDSRQFPEAIVADDQHAGVVHAACRNGDFYTSDDAGDSWRQVSLGVEIDDLSSLALTYR